MKDNININDKVLFYQEDDKNYYKSLRIFYSRIFLISTLLCLTIVINYVNKWYDIDSIDLVNTFSINLSKKFETLFKSLSG